jgi:hypothetical protein
MATWMQRVVGAAKLDVATYEEVEADKSATGQAMLVVVLSSVAAGIGAYEQGVRGIAGMALGSLLGWFVWAFLTWFIGTKILPERETKADLGELLRTIGFSASPGFLRVLGVVPILGGLVGIVVAVWMLMAMVVGVRQALDYKGTGRAVLVCLLGFAVYVGIWIGTAVFLGLGAWMLGSIFGRAAA